MWSSPVTGLLRRTRGGAISQNDDRGRRLPFAARRPVIQARLGVALTFGFGGGFGRDLFVFGHRRSGFSGRRFFSSGGCFRNLRSEEHTSVFRFAVIAAMRDPFQGGAGR